MKKLLLSIASLLVLSFGSTAQTITIDQMTPQIGDVYIQATSEYVSPGAAGANQTWDLSEMTNGQTVTGTIAEPAGFPGAASLPNASFVVVNQAHMQYSYSAVVNNRIELVGLYQTGVLMTYPIPQTQFQFPLSYQATYSDTYERFVDYFGWENQELGELSVVVDGYGTLITPAGTFTDVLRLKQEVQSDVISTSNGEFDSEGIFTSTTYVYVKAGYGNPLASLITSLMTSDFDDQVTEFGYYLIDASVGLDDLNPVGNLSVFPVPVINDFTVNLNLETPSEVCFNLFSVDGRIVAQLGKDYLPKGDNTRSLSLPKNTASGIYLLQIQTSESMLTEKIVVQ